MNDKEEISIGGSIFWILLILISLMGLTYLMIWSFHNNSIKGAIISTIFILMIITGILLSKSKVFDLNDWEDNALSFSLGFGIWMLLGNLFSQQSVLSVSIPQNYLFATIASELPILTETILNSFIIPIAEELFWMIGIPFALISIMKQLGKKYDIFNNDILQMFVIIIISSFTFALFHVGKMFIGFMIGAIIFRTILIVMVYGDYKFDIIKGVNLVAGFGIGAHMANNILSSGVSNTITVINDSLPIALIIYIFFAFIFFSAIERILRFAVGKDTNLIAKDGKK